MKGRNEMRTKNRLIVLLYSFISLSILAIFWIGIFNNYDPDKKFNQQITSNFSFEIDNNKYITSTDLKQKNLLIYFWASWCDNCSEEMRMIEKQWNEYKSMDYIFIGVNIFDNYTDASNFVRKNGITFPISYNGNNDQVVDFGVIGVPETIFISKNMNMTKKIIGPFDEKELVGSLEEIHIQ